MNLISMRPKRELNPHLRTLDKAGEILERLMSDGTASPVVLTSLLVPQAPIRWRAFLTSAALLLMLILNLVAIPIFFPGKFEPVRRYFSINLTRPVAANRRRAVQLQSVRANLSAARATAVTPDTPHVYLPLAPVIAKPQPRKHSESLRPDAEIGGPGPTFAPAGLPLTTAPTPAKPRPEVETGLLVEAGGNSSRRDVRANRPVIIDAAFSGGSGSPSAERGRGRSEVALAGFDSEAPTESSKDRTTSFLPPTSASVRILSKPAPLYTQEAIAHRVEGEVVVDVVFCADRSVRVVGVARGLGFGLDETAIQAARDIQFEPARRDGKRVDFPAVVRIVFSLAN